MLEYDVHITCTLYRVKIKEYPRFNVSFTQKQMHHESIIYKEYLQYIC